MISLEQFRENFPYNDVDCIGKGGFAKCFKSPKPNVVVRVSMPDEDFSFLCDLRKTEARKDMLSHLGNILNEWGSLLVAQKTNVVKIHAFALGIDETKDGLAFRTYTALEPLKEVKLPLTPGDFDTMTTQILKCLKFFEDHTISHGNIKLNNIMREILHRMSSNSFVDFDTAKLGSKEIMRKCIPTGIKIEYTHPEYETNVCL